jgi:uncharacterized membrane protein YhaH (DUF805 family)
MRTLRYHSVSAKFRRSGNSAAFIWHEIIVQASTQMVQPLPTVDVFISHSSKDKHWADAACAVLEQQGIRCWVAPRDIMPSEEWGEAIMRGINASRLMVVLFSGNANDSPMVRREVERAMSRSMPLLPLRIENTAPTGSLEFALSNTHWLDAFTPPFEEKLEKLAQTVKSILGTSRSARTQAKTSKTPPPPTSDPPPNPGFSPRKSLVECYLECWTNYVRLSGRSGRREFWVFPIVNLILLFLFVSISASLRSEGHYQAVNLVAMAFGAFALAVPIPTIAACSRRLHDTGRGAKWLFVAFIPALGPLVLGYWLSLPGDPASNQFGPSPAFAAKPGTS